MFLAGVILWLFSRLDMKNGETFRKQIHCRIKQDIALYRDCLRYCAGASVAQGNVSYLAGKQSLRTSCGVLRGVSLNTSCVVFRGVSLNTSCGVF